jgi:hypothetical protein
MEFRLITATSRVSLSDEALGYLTLRAWLFYRPGDAVQSSFADDWNGQFCEQLGTAALGQSTKSLRSSPLRGSKSREAGSKLRG